MRTEPVADAASIGFATMKTGEQERRDADQNPAGAHCSYCNPFTITSTRRFLARPSFVALSASGERSPMPRIVILDGSMPFFTRKSLTAPKS